MNVLLCLLDRAQPPAAQVPARVVVTRLLAAHAPTGRTQLRAETTLATAKPGHQTQGHQTVRALILVAEKSSNRGVGCRNWS